MSYRTARATLYKNFGQHQDENIAELDIRLSSLINDCNFPSVEITKFSLNYYEVKKWATQQKEVGDDAITYTKVIDKCKEHEASVRDYIMMASDNSQLKTAYQQGSATVDEKTFKRKQQKFGHKQRSRSRSGSRQRSTTPFKPRSKCKRCGFERHTTQDGKCPALKALCGYCNITGHYESACITKRTAQNKEARHGAGKRHSSRSPTRRPGNNSGRRPTAGTHTVAIKQTEQMRSDFQKIIFDNITTTSASKETSSSENFVQKLDTARDGKTYVKAELDVQLPHHKYRSTLKVKLDMGAEANILPLRTYKKMFPHQLLPDGTPDPQFLKKTTLDFECNKRSTIRSLGCIILEIGLPDKHLMPAQFFVSADHEQILIGHPSCDKLQAYTINVENIAPEFDQAKMIPYLELDNIQTRITTVEDLKQ